MAFRNGTPLIFSGSIDSTVSIGKTIPPSSITTSIPVGTLVSVMVLGKNYEDPPPSSTLSKSNKKKKDDSFINHFLLSMDPRTRNQSPTITNDELLVQEWSSTNSSSSSSLKATDHSLQHTWKKSKVHMDWFQKNLLEATLIGYGVWNPFSMYRVRMLCHQSSHPTLFHRVSSLVDPDITTTTTYQGHHPALESILETKIREAMGVRRALNLPSTETDSYRLMNGEGDGLSGLVVDVLGGKVAVIMSSALWCELNKDTILDILDKILHQDHSSSYRQERLQLIWRNTPSRLIQDGIEQVPGLQSLIMQNQGQEESSSSSDDGSILVTENGIKYYTYPWDLSSQKTGFYCDQRENRADFAKFCRDKRVLDLCSFNGGFALSGALLGHATHATGVDSSPIAIEAARKNAELNGLDSSQIQFIREDITQFMKAAALNRSEYDVIVLDPPKLAPSVGDLERASRKYHSLNRDAMKLINKERGGILMTCTCSSAMTQKDGGQYFLEIIKEASLAANRQITLLKTSGAAQCHTQCPASYPAGVYLTAAWIHVHPMG